MAGVDEAKEELQEIIEFLREPQKFQKLGGRIPKGVLLMGPPGTGKTLLARAIAGEANVPFFSISGSDFVEMFVGVGASRVRDLFEQGKKNAPCIIFIDEIDAVGRHRGAGLGGGHDEREQTLNQLLVEMDGFESNDGVILIAATNRPDVLDPALLRPGRFDRRVVVSRPDVRGREGILQVHTRKIPLADDVDISVLARATPGFSGADLANLVNEAALLAARRNQKFVTMRDFESSQGQGPDGRRAQEHDHHGRGEEDHRLPRGAATRSSPRSCPHADPLHKVTIIPRGMALGLTQQLPTEEKHNWTQGAAREPHRGLHGRPHRRGADLRADHHGRPERHRAGHGDGAQDGLRVGHERQRSGPLTYGKKEEAIFLGKEFNRHQDYSRGHRAQDRRRDQAHRRPSSTSARSKHPHREARRARPGRRGPARARGARRASSSGSSWTGEPIEIRVRERLRRPPPPPREAKVDEGERAGGILPPPMAAPKPTSLGGAAPRRSVPRAAKRASTPAGPEGGRIDAIAASADALPAHACGGARCVLGRADLVMGVLNVTPDSFSDGGRFAERRPRSRRGLRALRGRGRHRRRRRRVHPPGARRGGRRRGAPARRPRDRGPAAPRARARSPSTPRKAAVARGRPRRRAPTS